MVSAKGPIQVKRGTSAQWMQAEAQGIVLLNGELGYDDDLDFFRVGDGVTGWSGLPNLGASVISGAKVAAAAAQTSASAAVQAAQQATAPTASQVNRLVTETSLTAALPNTSKQVATSNDATPTTVRVLGLGSSVGVGATLPDPATQAPAARLFSLLSPLLSKTGAVPRVLTNGSVNGSTITQGQQSDYASAKITAGGSPTLAVLVYGMNDGMPEQYHRGETFPGVYDNGKTLIQAIQSDGSDVIIFTTPHPRTDIMLDSFWALSGSSQYPSATPLPATTQAASVVSVVSSNGTVVPASYRHLRVNESLRRLAVDTGAILVDVEKYWFDAVATYGLSALFNAGEYAHPNLLGHQQSYWLAIDDLVRSLQRSTVTAPKVSSSGSSSRAIAYKVDNKAYTSTTTLAADSQLFFNAPAGSVWAVTVTAYYTGSAGNLRISLALPSGAAGSAGIQGPGTAAGNNLSSHPMTSRRVTLPDTYGLPVGTNGADAIATYRALVRLGSTGGTIQAQFCQDTSSASTTTVYQDTYLQAERIS